MFKRFRKILRTAIVDSKKCKTFTFAEHCMQETEPTDESIFKVS